jgi:hypothetical protein
VTVRYIDRIKETTRAAREADERLQDYQGEHYPEDLNDAAWDAQIARQRAWLGKD